MWVSSSTQIGPRKSTQLNKNTSLDLVIKKKRQEFKELRMQAPKLRKRATALRVEALSLTASFQIRMAKDMLHAAASMEKDADERESMIKEEEYEEMVYPFLTSYHQSVEVDIVKEKNPRNIIVPGGSKKRETIDAYVQQYDATTSRQTTILNEYRVKMGEESPKVSFHTRDFCPICDDKMYLINTKAVITCCKCGYSATYLDATMTNMSYTDDVEFSSFSYKRINHFNEW